MTLICQQSNHLLTGHCLETGYINIITINFYQQHRITIDYYKHKCGKQEGIAKTHQDKDNEEIKDNGKW